MHSRDDRPLPYTTARTSVFPIDIADTSHLCSLPSKVFLGDEDNYDFYTCHMCGAGWKYIVNAVSAGWIRAPYLDLN